MNNLTISVSPRGKTPVAPVRSSIKRLFVFILLCGFTLPDALFAQRGPGEFEAMFFGLPAVSGKAEISFGSNKDKIYRAANRGLYSILTVPSNVLSTLTDEEFRNSSLKMTFNAPNGNVTKGFVYPYVVFKTKTARDNFIAHAKNGTEPLRWDLLDVNDIYVRYQNLAPPGFISNNALDVIFPEMLSGYEKDGGYLVMETVLYNSVSLTPKIDILSGPVEFEPGNPNKFKLDDFGNMNVRFKVTFTNPHPYPITLQVSKPKLSGLKTDNPYLFDAALYLLPYQQVTNEYDLKLLTMDGKTPAPTADGFSLHIHIDIQDMILNPGFYHGNIGVYGPYASAYADATLKFPANGNVFSLLSTYPLAFNVNELNSEKLKIVLRNPDKLGTVALQSGSGANTLIPSSAIVATSAPGIYEIAIGNYISAIGDYQLLVKDNQGKLQEPLPVITVSNYVAGSDPNPSQKKIYLSQDQNTKVLATRSSSQMPANSKDLLYFDGKVSETTAGGRPAYTFESGTTINGVLKIKSGGVKLEYSNYSKSYTLMPVSDPLFRPVVYYVNGKDEWPITTAGDFSISLSETELYSTEPPAFWHVDENGKKIYFAHKGVFLSFNNTKKLQLGSMPIAETPGLYIYNANITDHRGISFTGSASLGQFMGSTLSNFLQLDANIYDLRFNANGFQGIRADAEGFIGFRDPFGIVAFGGDAQASVDWLPENPNPEFRIAGGVSLGPIGGLHGSLAMKRADISIGATNKLGDVWLPNELGVKLEAPIPICPPLPIEINEIGGTIFGMADVIQRVSDYSKGNIDDVVLPYRQEGYIGMCITEDILGVRGTILGLWPSKMGVEDIELKLLMIPILKNGHYTARFMDTGEKFTLNPFGKTLNIPVVDFEFQAGATLSALDILTASVEGKFAIYLSNLARKMNFDMSKLNRVKTYGDLCNVLSEIPDYSNSPTLSFVCAVQADRTIEDNVKADFINTIRDDQSRIKGILEKFKEMDFKKATPQTYASTAVMGKNLYTALTEIVEASLEGSVKIQIPDGLPFGGNTLFYGKAGLDLTKIWGKAGYDVKAEVSFGGNKYGVNEHVDVTVTYNFLNNKFSGQVDKRSAPAMLLAGTPQYHKAFAVSKTDAEGNIETGNFYMPNFVAMTKNSEANPQLRAFSNTYENTKTQTMQNLSRTFLVAVRSKSPNTGLLITGPNDIVAERPVSELNWYKSDTLDYWQATAVVKIPTEQELLDLGAAPADAAAFSALTLAGDWKVETYNAAVTAFDANGLIDCDFYYTLKDASISNLNYAADMNCNCNRASWTNNDLAETATYRMKFSLVNATDTTDFYPVGATGEWTANEPLTEYTISSTLFESMPQLNTGDYRLRATLERLDGYLQISDNTEAEPMKNWLMQNSIFSGPFAHTSPFQPAMVTNVLAEAKNGNAVITWTAPADMSKVSGYSVSVFDEEGNKITEFKANAAATKMTIPASYGSSVEYYTPYTFTVVSFHEYTVESDEDGEVTQITMRRESNPVASNKISVSAPSRPQIAMIYSQGGAPDYRFGVSFVNGNGVSPAELEGMLLSARNDQRLRFYSIRTMTSAKLSLSEEMNAFAENNFGNNNIVNPVYTDKTALLDISDINDGYVNFPLSTFAEGIYDMYLTIANGDDAEIYHFKLAVDNTPPVLEVGVKVQNESGDWTISGTTEPGVTLTFNGLDYSSLVSAEASFTIPVAGDLSHINIQAIDAAGNISTVTAELDGVTSLSASDNTMLIRIGFDQARLKTGNTLTATAQVERQGVWVVPENGTVEWTIFEGGEFAAIDASTGVITPLQAGAVTIVATYLGALKDNAVVTIADYFSVNDLFVSQIISETSVKISFTEPQGATGKALEFSTDEPEEGEVNTGWQSIAAIFDGAGNATVNGLPADKTIYFRMFVAGGINDGYSNVAARGNLKTNTRIVIFDPQNGEDLIFVPVETGNTVNAPEEPVNSGLKFGGWYREPSCVNEWNFATDIVTADITLYACWKNPNSINEVQAGNLSLYPNPTNNQVTLSGLQGNETIQIFDMTGRQALTRQATGNEETVFVGNLAKGVYLVRVTREDFSVMLKLIVKN